MKRGGDSPYANYLRFWNERAGSSDLSRLLYADQKTYMVELLMKQDQMSMACSIESRVPFLDHPLVEFAARVPDRLKLRNGIGKYIVKKAAEGLVPHDILYRKKMGFPTPIRQWLRADGASGMLNGLLDRNGFLAEYLDLAPIAKLMERHRAGTLDATDRLWRLLNLQIWGDLYFTGRRERAWEGATMGQTGACAPVVSNRRLTEFGQAARVPIAAHQEEIARGADVVQLLRQCAEMPEKPNRSRLREIPHRRSACAHAGCEWWQR